MQPLIFLCGLFLGSFVNAAVYRLPRAKSLGLARSECPHCGEKLTIKDLIPVVSYLLLGGRCRYCNRSISSQYPLLELITAGLLVGLYRQYFISEEFIVYSVLILILLSASIIDLKELIIPNQLTYFGLLAGIIFSFAFDHLSFSWALGGILASGGFLLVVDLLTSGLGMGDVKLLAVVGSFLGPLEAISSLVLGSVVGSILLVPLFLIGLLDRETLIPFGPFISLGALMMVYQGPRIISFLFNLG